MFTFLYLGHILYKCVYLLHITVYVYAHAYSYVQVQASSGLKHMHMHAPILQFCLRREPQ